ncbi:MAG: sugar phosphate isomerase/epimerase [Phycisphaerales bacterium]|jgi:sugar phosphate isomerase/epimerase|nr:sugar phosphate isomerase/epimerase [Phycisphaerales bacterium]
MNERLCGCSFISPGLTAAQGMALVQRLGFAHVDVGLGGANANFDPIRVAENPSGYARQVREDADRLKLTLNECFLLNFGWPINAPDVELRRRTGRLFSGLCQFASQAGFKSVMVIPGPVHPGCTQEESLSISVDVLRGLVGIASDAQLRLNVEPDVDSCVHTPEMALRLCHEVNGIVLTLDYSHFVCQGIDQKRVDSLLSFVRHMHVRQASVGRIVVDVDAGEIDYPLILSKLERVGYPGLFCVEYLALDDSPKATREAERRTGDMIGQLNQYFSEQAHAELSR